MPSVECGIVRWVADEPIPGIVECRLLDAAGHSWMIVDKAPVFAGDLTRTTTFPVTSRFRCTIVDDVGEDGIAIDTEHPDGVESVEGNTRFVVARSRVAD